ncbi:MAG: hypothetical protein ACAI35_01195 [Candidatus Methylacidiphilales bacterium]|nr:hypothetical protein [Candidatus Methylacidiphilales bacterium]
MLHNSATLAFVPSASLAGDEDWPHVAIVTKAEELSRIISKPAPALQWIQVNDLISETGVWATASQGNDQLPFDVVVTAPAKEFSAIYRLVDVRAVRNVRITMPATSGFSKAVRLAASLGLPVRILPGQPDEDILLELEQAADFYLHHAMVEAPMEPFHTILAMMHEHSSTKTYALGALWVILEEDPALYVRLNTEGVPLMPRTGRPVEQNALSRIADFVSDHMNSLLAEGAECATCEWQEPCGGYFKWPDRNYSCRGVRHLFAGLHAASREMAADLADSEMENEVRK